jgi:hypothetical protein
MEQPATQPTANPDPTPAVETTHRCHSRKRNGGQNYSGTYSRSAAIE